jgi:GT2 family glycosyltransferase
VDPLSRVCLAVSSFKNDASVAEKLAALGPDLRRFARVLVVDSLGTGAFEAALAARGVAAGAVEYHCFASNLGSAGNLAKRLSLASQGAASFCYAVNHDGDIRPSAVLELVKLADTRPTALGAVYPLRRMTMRGGAYDLTGRRRFPFTAVRSRSAPTQELAEVFWSSSNGALYALEPVRKGLLPDADLWMGFEDLGYGWLLHRHGYAQYVARDVRVDDGYEYRKSAVGHITAKPAWYAYYYARNLIMTAKRTQQPPSVQGLALSRVLLEFGISAALRSDKRLRLRATAEGLFDALRNRGGKWRLP